LKEGDANSKIFHNIMSSRRRVNNIISLYVNGFIVEDVDGFEEQFLAALPHIFA